MFIKAILMYTYNILFSIQKKENHSTLSKISSYGIFQRDSRTNSKERSVFEPLKIYCMLLPSIRYLGPVVQSIVSLTSSLRGQLVKCFTTL